jgi:hypothetical protein
VQHLRKESGKFCDMLCMLVLNLVVNIEIFFRTPKGAASIPDRGTECPARKAM